MKEPIAYAAVAADGSESVYVTSLKEQAEACCREYGWQLVPLYAGGLQLSYQETEVLKSADALFQKCGLAQHAVVVRDILRRVEGQ